MKLKLTLATVAILIGTANVQAMPGNQIQGSWEADKSATGYVHKVAQRKFRRARSTRLFKSRLQSKGQKRTARGIGGANGFVSPGGVVKDTCNSSHPFYGGDCSPEALTSRCDDAGGGMSSEPGGGVSCDTSHWD